MPDIKGFVDSWGISVIHCPYCHGYEFRGQKTGLLANGARAIHLSGLIHNLTDDLTIFTNGKPDFTADQLHQLKQKNIGIVDTALDEIVHHNGIVEGINLQDTRYISLKALYAAIPFEQHSNIPESLGCKLTEAGFIQVDATQKTTVSGLYACGDNSAPMRSVANAVYTGSFTGAMVNMELVSELI